MQWYFNIKSSGKTQSSVGPLHLSDLYGSYHNVASVLFGVPPPLLNPDSVCPRDCNSYLYHFKDEKLNKRLKAR